MDLVHVNVHSMGDMQPSVAFAYSGSWRLVIHALVSTAALDCFKLIILDQDPAYLKPPKA